ncbi:hypothetical protein [Yersinia pestis]|uniref:hypothetical protein n=1 Tax=Yersinia pestis TaxID=632 RepID=UPI00084A1B9C|nr:hypothetical protein [Yersinia pestis]
MLYNDYWINSYSELIRLRGVFYQVQCGILYYLQCGILYYQVEGFVDAIRQNHSLNFEHRQEVAGFSSKTRNVQFCVPIKKQVDILKKYRNIKKRFRMLRHSKIKTFF